MVKIKGLFKWVFNKKCFPEFIFSIIFLFAYLPHFLFTWIPQVLNDSYAYFFMAKDIFEGNLPLNGYVHDLPAGYSVVIAIIKKMGGNFGTVILIQTIVSFLSYLFLIYNVKKFNRLSGFLLAVFAGLFLTLSDNILYNTLLYTESFYSSTIVVLTALLVNLKVKKDKFIFFKIAVLIFLAMSLRSNGIYLLFIPVFLFIDGLISKRNNSWMNIISLVLALFFSSCSNFLIKGYFFPGEANRNVMAYQHMKKGEFWVDNNKQKDSAEVYTENYVLGQTFKLFTNMANSEMANHYYYRMPKAVDFFGFENLKNSLDTQGYFERYLIDRRNSSEYAEFISDGVEPLEKDRATMKNITNINIRPRHFWLYSVHLLHLAKDCTRNFVVVFLFYLAVLIGIIRGIKELKIKESFWKNFTLISFIHIISIMALATTVPRDMSLSRYSIVTEFVVWVIISLCIPKLSFLFKRLNNFST
ncbi:MAG: hypothetical protein CMP61_09395 [Flavobacteriales bacterium]|nr:hypothetical protein [Flavobacteriales bacterium]|tara:strand:+ start:1023 stop:2435 length:1413 start_codon:yes stop_codon:yes gene_type:complete